MHQGMRRDGPAVENERMQNATYIALSSQMALQRQMDVVANNLANMSTPAFKGEEMLGQAAHRRFARGLAYVPEERRIVQGLSVRENLRLGLVASPLKAQETALIDEIATIFPRLAERLDQEAVTMSGGEQQMLAIARAMISKPDLIMLDEPSEGIMPVLVDEMFELFRNMKQQGTTILLVEQNVELALDIADRAYVLDQGSVVHHDTAKALLADDEIKERYCSV